MFLAKSPLAIVKGVVGVFEGLSVVGVLKIGSLGYQGLNILIAQH